MGEWEDEEEEEEGEVPRGLDSESDFGSCGKYRSTV